MTTDAPPLVVPDDVTDALAELPIHRICAACYPDVLRYENPDFTHIVAVCGTKPIGLMPSPGGAWCEECQKLWPPHRDKHWAEGWHP